MAAEIGVVLVKLVVLLGVAKLAGELFERMRQPAVLGELLAGVALGPSLLNFVTLPGHGEVAPPDVQFIAILAQIGVVVLLFEVGLESSLKEMMNVGRSSVYVAALGIFVSFGFGYAGAWILGELGFWSTSWLFHVFVGATLTATSVGITARVLSDMGRLATAEARIILGAAVLDDVGGLLILAVVTALAAGAVNPVSLALQFAIAIGFLVVALLVGLKLMPRALDLLTRLRVRGVLVAFAFGFALLMGWLAEQVHLAAIVGSFAGGLILAQTRHRQEIHERIHHVADILVPFFFVYVGLQLDVHAMAGDFDRILIAGAILLLAGLAGKLVCGFGVTERSVNRLAVGVGMVPRGEVGLIFALVGLQTLVDGRPLMEEWEYAAILLVVALTTFMTPPWLKAVLGPRPRAS